MRSLLNAADVRWEGSVPWGAPVPASGPGVYLVSANRDPDDADSEPAQRVGVSPAAVGELLTNCPRLRLDGIQPAASALMRRLEAMRPAGEPVLYIGLAGSSLSARVGQYHRTPLGAAKPHAGGWPLKCLGGLDQLWVHFALCGAVKTVERTMLRLFCEQVDERTASVMADPTAPLPFANLEYFTREGRRVRKQHGIAGASTRSR
ncbi:hypothetical protein [Mycobacterium sp. JS623]|uniref:hypothetical protein n=1 Tax=Mycobacterium sp. JS623 TaxID=212767 RepID=UPI0012FBB787|nr:hypothetical protein [Mycobacterium sp. JS623]